MTVSSAPAATVLLASGRPFDVVQKGAYVYWSELSTEFCASPGAIKRVPAAGGAAQTLYSHCNFSPANIAVDTLSVYAVDWTADKIVKIPTGGGAPTNVATSNEAIRHRGLEVDDTFVFWADDDGIKRAAKNGSSSVTLAGVDANDLTIDVANVYWTEGGPGSGAVKRIDKGGGSAQTLASTGLNYPRSIVVDESYAYWSDITALRRVPKVAGGSPATVYSETGSQMATVAVQGPFLYWSQTDSGGSIGSGKVRRISKVGGAVANVETGLAGPGHINLDNQYIYWGDGDGVKRAGLLTVPNLWIEGGQSFFNPEWGEVAMPAPAFPRGGTPATFRADVNASAVTVDILAPGVGAGLSVVKNVPLTQTTAGKWKGAWNWTSSSWSATNKIPVGAYVARYKVVQSGKSRSYELPMYVIFNPSEVNSPARFGFNEVGVWFFSPEKKYYQWGADVAIPYQLHPDDNRVFGQAILLVTGQTSPYQASQLINKWTTPGKRWAYTTTKSDIDVLDMLLRPDRMAQCADSANILVALLRAVGIPAHPSTGDARISQGTWVFDTWTEARMKSASSEDWFVFHPHEGYGPETRSVFGPAHGVSNKASNDLIIMAGANWVASEIADYCSGNAVWLWNCSAHDVKFKYGANKRPLQNMSYQANWLENVSKDYWSVDHWAMLPNSEREAAEAANELFLEISLDRDQYGPGDPVEFSILINNESDEMVEDELLISITADYPLTKEAGDELVHQFVIVVAVPPHGSESISDFYELPLHLSADNLYEVEAEYAGQQAAAPFTIAPDFDLLLYIPEQLAEGETFIVETEISNRRDRELGDIRVAIQLPRDLTTEDEIVQQIDLIPPGQSQGVQWHVTAQSQSEVSQVWVQATSEDGGTASAARGTQVGYTFVKLHLPLILMN